MTKAIQIMHQPRRGHRPDRRLGRPAGQRHHHVVSVPGAGAQKVATLVGETALLRFRQVLLLAPNYATAPTPTPTPTPSPSSSPTPSAKATASATPSKSSSARRGLGQPRPGGAAPSARRAAAASAAKAEPRRAPRRPRRRARQRLRRRRQARAVHDGRRPRATPPRSPRTVKALFDKLNCANTNWQQRSTAPTQRLGQPERPDRRLLPAARSTRWTSALVTGDDANDLSGVVGPRQTTGAGSSPSTSRARPPRRSAR